MIQPQPQPNSKPIRRWIDPRERRYSATTYDDVFRLIISDPKGIFRKSYVANSLPVYKDRLDHQDDFVNDLCEHLHSKYHDKPEELVDMFNSTMNYFFVAFCRRRMGHDGKHQRLHKERASSIDQEAFIHELPSPTDHAFDMEQDPVFGLRLSDPEVIEFLLSTKHFNKYTAEDKAIYRRWLDATRESLKRVNVAELARTMGLNEGKTRTLIDGINRILRARIRKIQEM